MMKEGTVALKGSHKELLGDNEYKMLIESFEKQTGAPM